MAFRFFRQNKELTRWLYIGVTIFVMVTFTVTGAMLSGLTDEGSGGLAGTFVTPKGKTVEISTEQFRRTSQSRNRFFNEDQNATWRFLMLETLAEEAGIHVPEKHLHLLIRQALPVGSVDEYERVLRARGISPPEFEKLIERQARVDLYQGLASDDPRLLSEKVYERFKSDNELFKLDYVAFSDEAEAEKLDPSSVSDEEMKRFYEEDLDPNTKRNEFSSPEKYGLDAALLAVDGADSEALRALLAEGQRDIGDDEVQRFYENNREQRYRVESDDEDGDAGESSEDDEGDDGEGEGDDDGEEESESEEDEEDEDGADEYRPLDEVRDEIVRELLVTRVINQAITDYRELQAAQIRKKAEEELKKNEEENKTEEEKKGEDESSVAEDGESAREEPVEPAEPSEPAEKEEDILKTVAGKYGLEYVDFGEPILLEEVKGLERIGNDMLESTVRFLQEGYAHPRFPTADLHYGFLIRMKDKVDAEPKPFDEIKDKLPEAWRAQMGAKNAEAAATAFSDAMRAKAREKATEEVARIEAEAREIAEKQIETDAVTDEAEKQKIIDRELDAVKPQIDAALAPHLGAGFTEVAQERGIDVKEVDWFRESYRQTAFYRDEEPSPAHFLKGNVAVFDMEIDGVVGSTRDPQSKVYVIARVADKKAPDVSEMTLNDRMTAEVAVLREIDPMAQFRLQYRIPDQRFSYEALAEKLGLRLPKRPDSDESQSTGS